MFQPTPEERKRFEKMSVCILTPCGGYDCSIKFTQDVVNMVAYSWMHGLKVYQMGITERMVVDWARNDLARIAKQHINEYTGEKFTHLLWLDDDHCFNPDIALWLAREDLPIVSALYYGRTSPHYPVVYVRDKNDKDEHKHFPIIEVPESLFKCDAVGFGALMMRREVLDQVPEPWFTLDWKAGEDIAFCVSAKKHGIEIYCDGRYKLGHIGVPPVITQKDFLKAKEDRKEIFTNDNLVRIELNG
jgi:hypothetical protein